MLYSELLTKIPLTEWQKLPYCLIIQQLVQTVKRSTALLRLQLLLQQQNHWSRHLTYKCSTMQVQTLGHLKILWPNTRLMLRP